MFLENRMVVDSEWKWQEIDERKYPKCCECGEHIVDDVLYDINGDIYCEECMDETFKSHSDKYMKE